MATYTWDGLTEVGTLSEQDGVYSNFSGSNYLQANTYPAETITKFDAEFVFTTSSDVNSWQVLTGQNDSWNNYKTPQFEIEDGHFQVLFSSSGSSWDCYLRTTTTISTNTNYKLHVSWDSSSTIVSATLEDLDDGSNTFEFEVYQGSSSITGIVWSVIMLIGYDYGFSSYMRGSIDLKHSYIKVNDQYFLCSPDSSGLCPYVGLNQCEGFYAGSSPVSKIYLGSDLIYGGS